MPSITVSLSVEVDGAPVPGFPVVRRSVVTKTVGFQLTQLADGNTLTFTALPLTSLSTATFFCLHVDQPVTVRMSDQGDAADRPALRLSRGALLLFIDGAVTESGANPGTIRVNNNSGAIVTLQGAAGGS